MPLIRKRYRWPGSRLPKLRSLANSTAPAQSIPLFGGKGGSQMRGFVTWMFAFLVLFASASSAIPADEPLQLKFIQNGKDLVVSTTLTVNNSSHVLWTHAIVLEENVWLYYEVFQNRDLLVRSQKQIEVKWRLAGHKKGTETYHVQKGFLPSSGELKDVLPQLQKLMQEGEKRMKELKR